MASYKLVFLGSGKTHSTVNASPTAAVDAEAKAKRLAKRHKDVVVLVYRSTIYDYDSWKAFAWNARRKQVGNYRGSMSKSQWDANRPT